MDGITKEAVMDALEGAGLRHQDRGRYILTQCPTHEDRSPSAQIYVDDWFVNCHATCGRYHITKAFPELKRLERPQERTKMTGWENTRKPAQKPVRETSDTKYRTFELYDEWADMNPIPRDHEFKGIPLTVLDHLGWRYDRDSYFIPYFTESRQSIPFAQWRHLTGERRFTNLMDAKPTIYGKWNLKPGGTYFIVEGTSDCAALEAAGVPWVGVISASGGTTLKGLADWCLANDVTLVYGGDNDEAGDKLRAALDEVTGYKVRQPPKEYKDYGEMFAAVGRSGVYAWCENYVPRPVASANWEELSDIQKIQTIWPGAVELKIV